ncbi:DUF4012 domain-containing protein [Patescibacteria group bacterium]
MKKYSTKFWITFWLISAILLAGWFVFWEVKNKGIESINTAISYLPFESENKDKYKTIVSIANNFLKQDDVEKNFLILFQNNLELRPGGGYIGTFGILKTKNGKVTDIQTHDLSNFDGRVPNTIEPPYPMQETLGIKHWKMRDSNYSPDFPVNAEKAEFFYHLGEGQEEFDGIIGLTANVLTAALKITGPISVDGYPGIYDSENAIITLEYQVEKGYVKQGIETGERKSIMNDLAKEIVSRVSDLSLPQKMEIFRSLVDDLDRKDIQLNFKDENLQKTVKKVNWGGKVDEDWEQDYLMVVDANLGAYKSDYYIKRSIEYNVDLAGDIPKVNLKITYNHTAEKKDWMTRDYLSYLRLYVPEESWIVSHDGLNSPQFGNEFGKKYFGFIVEVPIKSSRTVEFQYNLPEKFKGNIYNLKIQKQAGVIDVPVKINVTDKNETIRSYDTIMNADVVISDLELEKELN